ncbi:MAG: hypothetical protein EBE86_004195 [Hormoscilla sp. GUM202]|nr:hypothetical protein [Hormoscilla sp. GUM202]
MSNKVYHVNDYQFRATDAVLFDANVWLYIYGVQGDRYPNTRATYILALRRIRSVQGRIFLDVLVLSEFINAYSRFFYNSLPPATSRFQIFPRQ